MSNVLKIGGAMYSNSSLTVFFSVCGVQRLSDDTETVLRFFFIFFF